jgi:hypothetical protein
MSEAPCVSCRRDRALRCEKGLCGNCCDKQAPCADTNHSVRNKPRGTSHASQGKVERRSAIRRFEMAIWSSGIALNLDTPKQVAKLVYDHLKSSREMSDLSFLVPPGVLERAEAIIEPTMHGLLPADVEEAQDAGQQGSPSGVLSDHASLPEELVAQLILSCQHLDPAKAAARVEIRKSIWFRLQRMDESILDAAAKMTISEQRLQQFRKAQLPLAFSDTAQYERFKNELHAQVQAVLLKETSELANTISSILVIVNGISATFYSDKVQGLTKTFDNKSFGSSDLDVALVFEIEPYITL